MRIIAALLCLTVLSGCAPYRINQGIKAPMDKGYVVSRDGVAFPEYTISEDGLPPDNVYLARQRFKRRRKVVEDYYKKLGVMDNRFKENIPDRLGYFWGIVGSVFTLPVRTVNAYRYEYDPKYRERIDKIEEEKTARLKERVEKLRAELKEYIRKDMEEEKRLEEACAAAK